jgi:D-amino-acid dehydrogenase
MHKVIVIGAGILGASTAYHLAKDGAEVTLVDRNDSGKATDAAAGIVCPWLSQRRNKAWYALVRGGAKYYSELIRDLELNGEMETGYKQVGAISLHTDREKLEKMAERARKRREEAPEIGEITILSPDETRQLFPPLSDEFGSVYISGGARVNGRALRDALVNVAKKKGAVFVEGDASLLMENNSVLGIKINGQIIQADSIVITAGVWADKLLSPLGIKFLVTAQKAQIVHLDLPGIDTSSWPVVMPPNDQYILTFGNGRVVVGATHEDEVSLDNYRVTAGGVQEVLSKALAVAPGLIHSTVLETRVGFRPFTPGFLPIVGAIPEHEGLYLANGLGASGLTSGPFLGAELAKLILGETTELDLSLYDVAGAIEK